MFNSSDNDKKNNVIETLIGQQCKITGSIKGDDILKLDGSIEGDITCQNNVIVGNTGFCKGTITCENAYISGKVEGNVICSEGLFIENYGKVLGDITVKSIVIKDGGILDGKCTMIIADNRPNSTD